MKDTALSALLLILAIPVVTAAYAAIEMAATVGTGRGWVISMVVLSAASAALAAITVAKRNAV